MKKLLLGSLISAAIAPIALYASDYAIIIGEVNYKIFDSTQSVSNIDIKSTTINETDSDFEFLLPLSTGTDINKNATVEYLIEHIDTTDEDLKVESGKFTFKNGKFLPIQIKSNTLNENTEKFKITLSNPYLISIDNGVAVLSIQDDDGVPNLSIDDAVIVEGGTVLLKISLDKESSLPVSVDYFTESGDAKIPDYQNSTGTVTIAAGELEAFIEITTLEDTTDENIEDFYVKLTNEKNSSIFIDEGTVSITDNDSVPKVSIANASILENDVGTSVLDFNVSLSEVSGKEIRVDVSTSDITAISGGDYESTIQTLVFEAGDLIKKASVNINGDYILEDHETLTATLSNPVNTTIDKLSAIGTILNNDVIYTFNVLPLYGIVEYNDGNGWKQVVANTEYSRIFDFRYNPTEEDVLLVSKDVNIGSFDTDLSTPEIDGSHSINEWGTNSSGKRIYNKDGVKITTQVSVGNLSFIAAENGLGSTSTGEIKAPNKFTITIEGDFLNDVKIVAGSLWDCFDYANGCETKVAVDAYGFDNKLISSQGGYRSNGMSVDSYYFSGETAIKKFDVYPTPTNSGGNNPSLTSGNLVLSNMTISRSAFEVMDYKMIDVDGNEVTETLKLNINEGNANTNVNLNDVLVK